MSVTIKKSSSDEVAAKKWAKGRTRVTVHMPFSHETPTMVVGVKPNGPDQGKKLWYSKNSTEYASVVDGYTLIVTMPPAKAKRQGLLVLAMAQTQQHEG